MKAHTGILGFDAMTGGGLPVGRTTLIEGGPGSGKTVFALQSLVHGAVDRDEPGIFVAFEESAPQLVANADSFGWALTSIGADRLFLIDAQPDPNLIPSGTFDFGGLLAGLGAKADAMGARRIVFDAIDIALALMNDPASIRREMYRLHNWLLKRGMTAMITAKQTEDAMPASALPPLDFLQFMVDCSVRLSHDIVDGVSQRAIRVRKYRGSGFEPNPTPIVIGSNGIDVAYTDPTAPRLAPVSAERIQSGVSALDTMLGGGYFRGASVLVTGAPGTAKTTLCGAFAEAACRRGEKALFVSFDSDVQEIIRNLVSVGIDLKSPVDAGLLRLETMRALEGNAETHLMRIRTIAEMHDAQCIVIDPLSALSKSGNRGAAPSVAERLIDWSKARGMTVVCSSLLAENDPSAAGTPLQISTIADTWINLSYLVTAGERNRALSIIKSRGADHSNQVRELVLSGNGLSLTDVYTADGAVLMGTQRWKRERDDNLALAAQRAAAEREERRLAADSADLQAQIEQLRHRQASTEAERAALTAREAERRDEAGQTQAGMRRRRGGDARSAETSPVRDGGHDDR